MTKYCYSFDDEENFTGTFDSHKNALAEAAAENTEDRGMVFIGEVTSAKDILTRCAKWLGLTTFENMSECLYEEVGEAVEFFTMNDEQLQELAMLIVNHTEEKVGFNCFGVSNIVEIALPVVESEEMVDEEEVPECP